MDARIEALLENHPNRRRLRLFAKEVGKILAQIAAEFDPKRYTEDISEALLRAVDVQKILGGGERCEQ